MTWDFFREKLAPAATEAFTSNGMLDIVGFDEFFDTVGKAFEETKLAEVRRLLEEKNIVLDQQLVEYLEIYGKSKTVTNLIDKEIHIPESLVRVAIERAKGVHALVQLDTSKDYGVSKILSQEVYNQTVDGRKKPTLAFFITAEKEVRGKITTQAFQDMRQIRLMSVRKGKNGDTDFHFIGDPGSSVGYTRTLSDYFYVYPFETLTKKYYVLSKEAVRPGHCEVTGMEVFASDEVKITSGTFNLPSNVTLLFAQKIRSEIKPLSISEVRIATQNWNMDFLAEAVFGANRHPPWFERAYLAWLFSGKFDGYPLHIGIMGPAGTGKTRGMIIPLTYQIPEPSPGVFFDGTKSTLKGLVPSFGGKEPQEGYFAKCERIAYVDEFLTSLKRMGGPVDDNDETGMLTTLLEHMPTPAMSGRGQTTMVHPTAKLILTTNPERGLSNLVDCAMRLKRAFMSRVLWYQQTEEHIAFINKNKARNTAMRHEDKYPKQIMNFRNVYDAMLDKTVDLDYERIDELFKQYHDIVPEEMKEVYMARYNHHLMCLVDGFAKLAWLTNQRVKLKATDDDYAEAESVFATFLMSWGKGVNFKKIPIRVRERYLSVSQMNVFQYVSQNAGCKPEEIQTEFGRAPRELQDLLDLGLVKVLNGGFYPHWHISLKMDEVAHE